MPAAEVYNFSRALFAVNSKNDISRFQKSKALRLIEVGACDMKIAIILNLVPFKKIVRKIRAGYSKCDLGSPWFNSSTVRCGNHNGTTRVSDGYGKCVLWFRGR